ncbi:MAG: hypothetical protein K6G06_02490, partial [Butyrivibrio sp.]|nr:hypothetical protein [Butyrivibrio sp.]
MKKRHLMTAAVLATTLLSACSFGKNSESVDGVATQDEGSEGYAELLNDSEKKSDGTDFSDEIGSGENDQDSAADVSGNDENNQAGSEEPAEDTDSANTDTPTDGFIADAIERVVAESGAKTEDARYCQADDFDGDGEEEAFVFVGSEV